MLSESEIDLTGLLIGGSRFQSFQVHCRLAGCFSPTLLRYVVQKELTEPPSGIWMTLEGVLAS